jgi:hypothetical protein
MQRFMSEDASELERVLCDKSSCEHKVDLTGIVRDKSEGYCRRIWDKYPHCQT